MQRCSWCGDNKQYLAYHDKEWGVPLLKERQLFEFLMLEGQQAGLSWITILKKRSALRKAFAKFDPKVLATFTARDISACLANPEIIRNRLKCESMVSNAKAYLAMRADGETLKSFCWSFTEGLAVQNQWRDSQAAPASTPESAAMSRALKQRGFRFVGPTICYAFMQAIGMVNDHAQDCFRYQQCQTLAMEMNLCNGR
jgi:DNA-3-methyladenine glycosylase I